MEIIDSHVHMGPMFDVRPGMFRGTNAADVLRIMDEAGITACCVFPPLWEGPDLQDHSFEAANEAIFREVQGHRDRLIPFARVNPNLGYDAIRELERCHSEYNCRGLKLHPSTEHFSANNIKLLRPYLERCQEWGWPVFFHSGYYPTCQPALFVPLAQAFPEVPMILAHIGYAHYADLIVAANTCPNIYIETSANSTSMVMKQVLRDVPVEQFVYGSDLPFTDPTDVMRKIRAVPGLSESAQQKIFAGNIKRILG